MPTSTYAPTPGELVNAVSLALQKLGLRQAAGGAYDPAALPIYQVQHIASGSQADAAASGYQQVVITFNTAQLAALNFEKTAFAEQPPRNAFPS